MSTIDNAAIKQYREETPGCVKAIHLNNAGAALMPRPVIDAVSEYLDYEAVSGGYEAYAGRLRQISTFYRSCAKLLNTRSRNVAFAVNATDAFARALSSIPFDKGDVILTSSNDYISNQIQFISLGKRFGVELIHVPDLPEGGIDPEALEKFILKYSPKMVSISHVPTNSGLVQDVYAVGDVCSKYGITYIVDACQSAGQMPLHVESMQCDFLSATMRKWLRGPRGAGFLYVSDNALEKGLEPLMIDMRGAQWTGPKEYIARKDAKRFEDWEHNYALTVGSTAALDYAMAIGLESISERVNKLAHALREKLRDIDRLKVLDDGSRLCGITSSFIEGAEPKELIEFLHSRRVNAGISLAEYNVIDFGVRKQVPWALRMAPHYYNTSEEIDECIDALVAFTSSISHRT